MLNTTTFVFFLLLSNPYCTECMMISTSRHLVAPSCGIYPDGSNNYMGRSTWVMTGCWPAKDKIWRAQGSSSLPVSRQHLFVISARKERRKTLCFNTGDATTASWLNLPRFNVAKPFYTSLARQGMRPADMEDPRQGQMITAGRRR